jgi:hypothetical protein
MKVGGFNVRDMEKSSDRSLQSTRAIIIGLELNRYAVVVVD